MGPGFRRLQMRDDMMIGVVTPGKLNVAQSSEQIQEGVICRLIIKKSWFPAFRHIRHHLDRSSEIGIRVPRRGTTGKIVSHKAVAVGNVPPDGSILGHLVLKQSHHTIKGLEPQVKFVSVDIGAQHKQPAVLEKSPSGVIPLLHQRSHRITEYLDNLDGDPRLSPASGDGARRRTRWRTRRCARRIEARDLLR